MKTLLTLLFCAQAIFCSSQNSIGLSTIGWIQPKSYNSGIYHWERLNLGVNYNFRIKRSELKIEAGIMICHFSNVLRHEKNSSQSLNYSSINGESVSVRYYNLDAYSFNDLGYYFTICHRFYLAQNANQKSISLKGFFWGNNISWLGISESFALNFLDYNNNVYNPNGKRVFISGVQHFNVIKFGTEGGYRFRLKHSFFMDLTFQPTFLIKLTKYFDDGSPWLNSKLEFGLNVGYTM